MTTFSGFGLSLSNEIPVPETLAMVRDADRLGFDEVSLPESRQFRSVFTVAAAALATTEQVTVRIGVANPVTRHPAVLAMEAGTLAELAPGRVRFGIGAAAWTMHALGYAPEGWKPYTNTVEAVRAVRRLVRGEELGFSPTTFPGSADTALDFSPGVEVPVDVGAVSTRMMEAAGEVADGVQLGALTSPGYVRWARERIAAGAARAGRDPTEVLVAANVLTSVGPDRRAARDAVREVLAYYLYRVEGIMIEACDGADPEAVAAVASAVAEGGVAEGAGVVSDELIDAFAVAGTVDDVVGGLRPFADAGLDVALAWYTFGPDSNAAVETLAREVRPVVVR